MTIPPQMNGSCKPGGDVSFMGNPLPTPSYEHQFLEAMQSVGIDFKGPIIADGKIHRFASGSKRDKDGWYVFFGLAGVFGDWSQGIQESWSLKRNGSVPLNFEDLQDQLQQTKRQSAEETLRKQEEVAAITGTRWGALSESGQSPYLERKQIEALWSAI